MSKYSVGDIFVCKSPSFHYRYKIIEVCNDDIYKIHIIFDSSNTNLGEYHYWDEECIDEDIHLKTKAEQVLYGD